MTDRQTPAPEAKAISKPKDKALHPKTDKAISEPKTKERQQ